MVKEISINGKIYVLKSETKKSRFELPKPKGKYPYKIVRTYSAVVFAGYLKSLKNKEAVLLNARRLWYWDGAASLSQLAMEGVSKPHNCKFPCEVSEVLLTEVIEVLAVSKKAKDSIDSVPVWQK